MPLTLVPMTAADYDDWLAEIVPGYAADKVANGTWAPAEAPALSRASMGSLLPQGRETPGHFLHTLTEAPGGRKVGWLWFARQGSTAYLYDIFIHADCRRQGFGREAMRSLEATTVADGFLAIKLHVFGQNQAARALYQSLGYTITDLTMRKELPGQP